jgi:hypothetical protein
MSKYSIFIVIFGLVCYCLGMLTVSLFALGRIARAERGWCRHKGDCSELLAGEWDE